MTSLRHRTQNGALYRLLNAPARGGALSDDAVWRLTSVWRLSVAYIGPKSRTDRLRKTKIGTEVAYVTRDSDTTFKVKRSKVNFKGAETYCGGLSHSWLLILLLLSSQVFIFIIDAAAKSATVYWVGGARLCHHCSCSKAMASPSNDTCYSYSSRYFRRSS